MLFNNISYAFNKKVGFTKNLSFNLEEEKVNFLIGKNGSGKTTLIDIILGLRKSNITPLKAKDFIYINQMLPILDSIKVKDAAELVLGIEYGISNISLSFLEDKVDDYTYNFLKSNWDKRYSELSGGNQKLSQLLLFLQVDRKLVVLDEPTAFLDRQNAMKLFNVIKKHSNRTYLIVTHDIRDLRAFEQFRVVFLEDAKVKASFSEKEFLNNEYDDNFLDCFLNY